MGDEWVLNGQKIWTSQATETDMMFGLFRTEPDAPKHAGISYLLIPMKTKGIDARPLTMMQGGVDFCEVFFDDVRIPARNIVGKRGEGWKVTRATLKHERLLIGDSTGARMAYDALVDAGEGARSANGAPAIADPLVRQRLAEAAGYVATQEWAVGAHAHRHPQERGRRGDRRDADGEAAEHERAAAPREARARSAPRRGPRTSPPARTW